LLKAKAKAKDLTFKAEAKAKDSKFVLEDSSRPRTKAKDNNTAFNSTYSSNETTNFMANNKLQPHSINCA